MCSSFWRKNIEEIKNPFYSSSSWCSWALPWGSLGISVRAPEGSSGSSGPNGPSGFPELGQNDKTFIPSTDQSLGVGHPQTGASLGGRLPAGGSRGSSANSPSSWDSQPFSEREGASGGRSQFSLQLSSTVCLFFKF